MVPPPKPKGLGKPTTKENEMNDEKLVELARSIAQLPEYQRKELSTAIKYFETPNLSRSDLAKLFETKD